MAFHLPSLPLSDAAWIFGVLMALILLVPMASERVRVPSVVGLVVAGMVVGPAVLGLLERDGAVAVLGTVGLLYLMFVAGLELDLDDFAANRSHALGFGGLTFLFPMLIGTAAMAAMGFELLAAILLASCWASHTLLSYPTYRRLGTHTHRSVATSVGATIITDTAALIVLVVVARAHVGDLDAVFWLTLVPSLLGLAFVTLWVLPRIARWFFAGIGQDRGVRFLFIMVALFASSMLAELAGIEAIIGAFLAGLALNRQVPNDSVLMERVEFLGSMLLIPIFLLSVGMLIDPTVLTQIDTLGVAAGFIAVALGAKLLAAVTAGKLFRYDTAEIGTMFSLSSAQAAATLAAVIVGLDVGLIDTDTVNAVILVILVTCIVSSWAGNRWGARLPRPAARRSLGQTVVVPVANPGSRSPLVQLASAIARRDSGFVVPLTVVGGEADEEQLAALRKANAEAESLALSHGAEADGIVRIDASPASGILHTLVERGGSLLVLGWKGSSGRRESMFGGIIDEVLATAPVPVLIARLRDEPATGILLAVTAEQLTPAGRGGLELALTVVERLAKAEQLPVRVLTDTDDAELQQAVGARLGVEMKLDERKRSISVRQHAGRDDLVVVPVKPATAALRGAAARIARAVPDNPILVPLDARVAQADSEPAALVDVDALASRTTPGDPAPPMGGRPPAPGIAP
jgi:Kef-type K+ transport system membrane component KefB/nucleotide-binding universal stress UspA family protein